MVKTSFSSARDVDSIPGRGTKIPHTLRRKKPNDKKQKQYCKKFYKDCKNGPHQKIF